jgi:UDP:flavonoid glycosyltransferase YjiC (YdhE family)
MLALAQTLLARGHHPVIAAPPNFASWAQNLGFEFAPVGVDIQVFLAEHSQALTGNPLKMLKEASRYFNEQMPLQAMQLQAVAAGAQALIYGGLALTAPSVADHLRLPVLGVLYTNCLLPSSQHPPISIPWHGLPPWMNDLLWRANNLLGESLVLDTVNTVRSGFGLPTIKHIRKHLFDEHPVVIAADEVLFPDDPLWNGRYPHSNYLFFDDPAPLDPELDAWLADGEPPVFVGFGSMSGAGTSRVENMIVKAVCATNRRCIVGAGWAGLGTGALPSNWRVVRDAPHALLFPRTAVVVHHGGSGTMAQALRAGVPQVLLPLILDQFHHAHRLHLAGIAPDPVPMEKVTADRLSTAIHTALALPPGPRLAAAQRLRAADGRTQVAQRLEQLVLTTSQSGR